MADGQQNGALPVQSNKAAQIMAALQQLQQNPAQGAQMPATPQVSNPLAVGALPMGPVSNLDQQLQSLIAQGSQLGLQQEPAQLGRAHAVGDQVTPLLQQQAALAGQAPQMPSAHFSPVHGIGSLFKDIGEGALALGMTTRPGAAIREQMYESRLAPWKEKMEALQGATNAAQAQQQLEQQPLSAEAQLIYHPMMAGASGMRGEGILAQAQVHAALLPLESARVAQGWERLSQSDKMVQLHQSLDPILAQIRYLMSQQPTNVAEILAQAKMDIANVASQSDVMREHGFLADIDNFLDTELMPKAPQTPGGAAPTATAMPPASSQPKSAPSKTNAPKRPKGVPANAVWNAGAKQWQLPQPK